MGRDWSLFKKIRLPKQSRLPQALSDVEVRRILANIRNPIHRACFGLIYARSLRISEAANLEVSAIAHGMVRVIGKGNKDRLIPLPQPVHAGLRLL